MVRKTKRINEDFDHGYSDLEELMRTVTSDVIRLSERFKEFESKGYSIGSDLSVEEEWAFDDLNEALVPFVKYYCYY